MRERGRRTSDEEGKAARSDQHEQRETVAIWLRVCCHRILIAVTCGRVRVDIVWATCGTGRELPGLRYRAASLATCATGPAPLFARGRRMARMAADLAIRREHGCRASWQMCLWSQVWQLALRALRALWALEQAG